MTRNKHFFNGICAAAVTLCLGAVFSHAQNTAGSALISTPNGYPVSVDGAEIHLGFEPIDGDLTLTGANALLVLDPGEHAVNGSVNINAKGDTVMVAFDKKKQYGSLKVGGTLNLGPDNAPILALDLSRVGSFTPGETFTIVSAGEVHGHFSGLDEGDSFEIEDVKLRISYDDNSIIITVISSKRPWDRHRTPVVEIDTGLIDPTSTAPGSW